MGAGIKRDPDHDEQCPICGSTNFSSLFCLPDPLGGSTFELLQCSGCGLGQTRPRLTAAQLEPYYNEIYWHDSDQVRARQGVMQRLEQWFIDVRMAATLRALRRLATRGGKVLDVGCGTGSMLKVLAAAGFEPYGLEVSPTAVRRCRERFGERVACGDLTNHTFEAASFDAVTLFHVLEHLDNPVAALHEAQRLLKPGGLLLIEVPNLDGAGFRVFGRRWYPLDVPLHLFHFTPRALERLLITEALEPVRFSFFSARASCAAWVVSLFPVLDPRRIRRSLPGGRGIAARLIYLVLQLLVLPLAVASAAVKRGETIQVIAAKSS